MKLNISENATPPSGPVVLLVLDGVGEGRKDEYDAVHLARKPNLEELRKKGLYMQLRAHGTSVGLPSDSDIGNSEVGHNILGAGRIFSQGATSVENAIQSGEIWNGKWSNAVKNIKINGSSLHLIGLISDGNVHSHIRHLIAMVRRAAQEAIGRVFIHAILDGRDVPDNSAQKYIKTLEDLLSEIRDTTGFQYYIASGGGRMEITMDRYNADWSMVERGWQAHVLGEGKHYTTAIHAIEAARSSNPDISDQYIPAFVIEGPNGLPRGTILDGDSVILFNFRGDRAIEITKAFCEGNTFEHFDRKRTPRVYFAGMTLYDGDTGIPSNYLINPQPLLDTLSECLADTGITQFACAETQKYGHITYFWNGNRSEKFDAQLENYVEIPSSTTHFEDEPWMKSAETADAVVKAINSKSFSFIRANFAGGDMVGHSGKLIPSIISIEAIDLALGRIAKAVKSNHGCLVITSDHGNSEDMVERSIDGQPIFSANGEPIGRTSHTLNPVPFIIWDNTGRSIELHSETKLAGLSNVAATIIELLGYIPPDHFNKSLISINKIGD